jgi:hypothetical protein
MPEMYGTVATGRYWMLKLYNPPTASTQNYLAYVSKELSLTSSTIILPAFEFSSVKTVMSLHLQGQLQFMQQSIPGALCCSPTPHG